MAHSNHGSSFVDSSRLIGVSLKDTFAHKFVRSQLRSKTTKVFVLETDGRHGTNGEEPNCQETSGEETDSDDEETNSYDGEPGSDGEEPKATNCE
jgi:hypothetical protein